MFTPLPAPPVSAPYVNRLYKDIYLDINALGATPPSGQIAMSDINGAFGWGNDINAYRGRQWFTPQGQSGTFPTGQIAFSDFYNKQPNNPVVPGAWDQGTPGQYNFTVPNNNGIQVQVWGAGGGGGGYNFGDYAPGGQESRVYLPNGEQVAGGGGAGGQGAETNRKGGVRFGVGGGGGGAGGGNQQNVGGEKGGDGDQSFGGASPAGGGRTGITPYREYDASGYNGNWPGGGGSGGNSQYGGRFQASSGGGGGAGYARSVWSNAFVGQNIVVVVGAQIGGGCSVGGNGRVYINWW